MIILTTDLTPEQSAWVAARGGIYAVNSAGLDVTVLPDGTMQITLPADLSAALTASAPGWVEDDRLANL